jgi:copper chaperone CopZ
LQPIELKVPMCCEKCAKKVKDRLLDLEGVENVVTDQYNQKVIVYGHADPQRVLNRVKLVKKRSVFWDLTVDYSKEYRRFREAQAEAARADSARAEAAEAEAHAKAVETHAKAMVASSSAAAPITVVVNLPQEQHGPKVTAILPDERERAMPYAVSSWAHSHRYVSPPKAYRQEFYHGHRQDGRTLQFYNGRHADPYF